MPAQAKLLRETLRPGIEQDTELMPWLGRDLPAGWGDWLEMRAERLYRQHAHFRRLILRKENTGRDYLYRFFRHWLASRMKRERFRLFRQLPDAYCLGAALPKASGKSSRQWLQR